MLSKCVIDGTKHSIVGGAVCIDGTIHQLRSNQNGSYVYIGGTSYHTLRADQWQLYELGRNMTRYAYAGYEAATGGKPSISLAAANTYFVLYMYNGYVGIYKMVSDGSSVTSTLIANNSTGTTLTTSGTTVTPSTNRYGSTMIAYTFDGDEDDVVNTLQSYEYVRLAGRNSATAGEVRYDSETAQDPKMYHAIGDWWIQCTNDYFCLYTVANIGDSREMLSGLPSRIPSASSTDMTRTYISSSVYYRALTLDKQTSASVHGGSIISCRRK